MKFILAAMFFLLITAAPKWCEAQYGFAAPGGYGLKIYQVNSALYPYVQVYFRTFNQNLEPLVNLNERNIGLMVQGRCYDPAKQQYFVSSIRQRQEATRSVVVIDASRAMAGRPFEEALKACARFIDAKRPQDEVAIIAVRNNDQGYALISGFERDSGTLARRLADLRADVSRPRLYDAIAAALEMCASSSQGSVIPSSANVIVSSCIVVMSDGLDEGSAISRQDLNMRISNMHIPIPIYSMAFSRINPRYFRNLESLSKNSLGKYYQIAQTYDKTEKVVEDIQNIIQSDYVLTFLSYIPVDGQMHLFKIGVEYPSGSGKYVFDGSSFESMQLPPTPALTSKMKQLSQMLKARNDGPYVASAYVPGQAAKSASYKQNQAAPARNENVGK